MINKKWNEIEAWVPTLKPGTYDLTVDCIGEPVEDFLGKRSTTIISPGKLSLFGLLFSKTPKNVYFNLTFGFPDDVVKAGWIFGKQDGYGVTPAVSDCFKSITITKGKNLKELSYMFTRQNTYCEKLDIPTNILSNLEVVSGLYSKIKGLTTFDMSIFNPKKIIWMDDLFSNCSNLKTVITGNKVFENVTNTSGMFSGCSGLTEINTKPFSAKIKNAQSMFNDCSLLTSIDASFITDNTTNTYSIFKNCTSLTDITFGEIPITDTDAFLNAPIKTAKVAGLNANVLKDAVVNAAATSKWPTSATWTVEQTKLMQFIRIA